MDNKISVIIPCFNHQDYITESINSILNQENVSELIEVIVVDDGSTDDSFKVVKEKFGNFKNVKLLKEPHRGIVGTVSKGLEIATGSLIALQGADDISKPERIEKELNVLLDNKNIGLVFSDASVINKNGERLYDSYWKFAKINPKRGNPVFELLKGNFASGGTFLFRKEILNFAIPIPSFLPFEDWWIVLIAATFSKIEYLNDQLLYYRFHGGNTALKVNDFFTEDYMKLYENIVIKNLEYRIQFLEAFQERLKLFDDFIDKQEKDKILNYAIKIKNSLTNLRKLTQIRAALYKDRNFISRFNHFLKLTKNVNKYSRKIGYIKDFVYLISPILAIKIIKNMKVR
ncbi:MAG: glycosyltransferase [Thermotogae bacterium]|jgi:glycosyltransferase involved in cell wall biosynthesis|nr:glycosyltransferase [Thermotogota bacterium]MCL5033033.1 glycosyltransferase [Thermotogota bacterium]